MTEQRNVPTCEIGFWKPEVDGCPVCGPHGPCTVDPVALRMAQIERAQVRHRQFVLVAFLWLFLIALSVWWSLA